MIIFLKLNVSNFRVSVAVDEIGGATASAEQSVRS